MDKPENPGLKGFKYEEKGGQHRAEKTGKANDDCKNKVKDP